MPEELGVELGVEPVLQLVQLLAEPLAVELSAVESVVSLERIGPLTSSHG